MSLKAKFPYCRAFETFGVAIAVHVTSEDAIKPICETIREAFPFQVNYIDAADAAHHFYYRWNKSKRDSLIDPAEPFVIGLVRADALNWLRARLRLKVAEFAVDHVFVHAGVVGWKGQAIMIPGLSLSGKSTLVAELIRRGALYYSDEYAIIDKKGRVSPFPKTISLRENGSYVQTEYSPDHFGGRVGRKKIPVGLVLITRFSKAGRWRPAFLSAGQTCLEILKNTVPVRNDPSLSLSIVSTVAEHAICVKTPRSAAAGASEAILTLLDRSR